MNTTKSICSVPMPKTKKYHIDKHLGDPSTPTPEPDVHTLLSKTFICDQMYPISIHKLDTGEKIVALGMLFHSNDKKSQFIFVVQYHAQTILRLPILKDFILTNYKFNLKDLGFSQNWVIDCHL